MASLKEKKLYLLDMDGTLYLDERLFDKVPEFLSLIRRRGGRYLFLTNNSSRGVEGYIDKMRRLGIETAAEDYMTSADVAEHTLLTEFAGQKCYVSGTTSLKAQLRQAGVNVTDTLSGDISVLLSGFDTELTFQKLEDSCILLNRGVTWLATNPDWVCPTWYGSVPDCGSWRWHAQALPSGRPLSSETGSILMWPAASTRESTAFLFSAARALWTTSFNTASNPHGSIRILPSSTMN